MDRTGCTCSTAVQRFVWSISQQLVIDLKLLCYALLRPCALLVAERGPAAIRQSFRSASGGNFECHGSCGASLSSCSLFEAKSGPYLQLAALTSKPPQLPLTRLEVQCAVLAKPSLLLACPYDTACDLGPFFLSFITRHASVQLAHTGS